MPLNEADTRAKLIDPALHRRGWSEDMIRRETTAGAIEIIGVRGRRRNRKKSDYVLRLKIAEGRQPVAVALIEAKKEDLPPAHGLEQAKNYSRRLNVPFVFSANGHQFVEYDAFTGKTSRPRKMEKFPKPEDLRHRYEEAQGFGLEDPIAKPLLTPYHRGEGTRRYYQDASIRAALEKIARCENAGEQKRILLSLATGTGKTFIAVHLLKRIADAGQLKRALFLCDRDELRTQAHAAFANAFGSDAAIVSRDADGKNAARNARVHVATYQTLGVENEDDDASFLTEHYPENHFSHVIIDECHRSAWNKWSQVLRRNPDAVHVGLTATPRKITATGGDTAEDRKITANNLEYFGEPTYEYGIGQGMEDGYLAAWQIRKDRVDIDETGVTQEQIMVREPRDATTGKPATAGQVKEAYEKHGYERILMLPDRVQVMCEDLFAVLLESGDPEQKTIIFCVRDRHADDVAGRMNNLYADWCRENNRKLAEPYAFKCTAAAAGNEQLPDFRNASRHHFIATTVDLLTTGVDVPCVRNIAFFKYVRSPISLYQMIGRGTRIHEATEKLMFTVHDYTDATDLLGAELETTASTYSKTTPPTDEERERPPPIEVDGFDVHIAESGSYVVVEEDGRLERISTEEYRERLARSLAEEVKTPDDLRRRWIEPEHRRALLKRLRERHCSAEALQTLQEMQDYDLYDILADLGFGMAPRTRTERAEAFDYKNEKWLKKLPPQAAAVIKAFVRQFERNGTEELESQMIFQTPAVKQAGGIAALQEAGVPKDLLQDAKERVFAP